MEVTGRTVNLESDSWLDGPVGEPAGVGRDYFQKLAEKRFLEIRQPAVAGLVADFSVLRSSSFDPACVAREVIEFYQATSNFNLDAWSEWMGAFRPFGFLLARIFSRRLQQLNVPLSSLDTSRGITSEVLQLVDPLTQEVRLTAWVRELLGTGNVLYAGAYSTCRIPRCEGLCIKVVFPLPNGNAMVIMRPVVHSDGSFSVVSRGTGFGDAGFYFTVHSRSRIRARYLKSLREGIRVYRAEEGTVRADHTLSLWGITFLRLHYRLQKGVGAKHGRPDAAAGREIAAEMQN
ncbi:MAG TPA: hypothetical protein VI488_04705 [Candidatus Angelobacter sp.]